MGFGYANPVHRSSPSFRPPHEDDSTVMSRAQSHCQGCNRVFTPHGLSQHVTRSPHPNCRALQGTNIPSNHDATTWDHGAGRATRKSGFEHGTTRNDVDATVYLDTDITEAMARVDHVDPSQDTARANHEDTTDTTHGESGTDPEDAVDADLLEVLTQEFNLSMTVNPEAWSFTPSDHPQSVGSQPDDPVQPPPDPPEPGDSGGATILVVDEFPCGEPGAAIPSEHEGSHLYRSTLQSFQSSLWAPFRSQCDWEIARWAKMRGPSSSAVVDLLVIPEVVDKLGLSYRTPKELNYIIDQELPGRPPFKCHDMVVAGCTLQLYSRDILQCIRTLFGDPEYVRDMAFAPKCHYTDSQQTCRVYSEMYTGDWWWAVQTSLEAQRPGATVVLVIISSNKTQLTLFRGKAAYPVYLTIGNIPKDIRRKPSCRAQILVAYFPTSWLEEMANKAGRRRTLGNIFHSCMQKLVAPIAACGETSVAMMSGNGIWHRCHPILAAFVGDYPEQALVTCTYQGRCPKCLVEPDELGDYSRAPPQDYEEVLDTYQLAEGDIHTFHAACCNADLKPVFHPFWVELPLINIFISITPDILHQMLQGVMKHLITWVTTAFGSAVIDACCQALPPNNHIHTFARGISVLSHVTGLEHKQMCCILLRLIIDLPLPSGDSPSRIIKVVHALLDFLYLAQLPSHTSNTLIQLEDSLARFHEHKSVFVDLGVCEHFQFPKIHSLLHYSSSMTLFRTTDNYNTEQTECLHIEYTKNTFHMTNKKEEKPQMTGWNECCEKVKQHTLFVKWHQQAEQERGPTLERIGPSKPVPRSVKMTQHPTLKAISFNDLVLNYQAFNFPDALADFITCINNLEASATALRGLAEDTLLPF
ncbi:hypothetical protein EI94DRAFT_1828626 [Lactarius quietus]|nr:hypothetical protein EI94DRAFT_1828626 [Lactarius quietus]